MADALQSLEAALNRLAEITGAMEQRLAQLSCDDAETGNLESSQTGDSEANTAQVGATKIVASVEPEGSAAALRGAVGTQHLEQRLEQAEQALASLQAAKGSKSHVGSPRKTLPAATVQLLAKQGIDTADSVDVQSLDAALAGMSVEHRIAVKSQMLRTGSLTL